MLHGDGCIDVYMIGQLYDLLPRGVLNVVHTL